MTPVRRKSKGKSRGDCIECKDPRCPVHGSIKTRGSELDGVVVSAKARKTVIITRPYTIFLKKYERYVRKNSRIAAHNPECMSAKEGDLVMIAETRRISKTKSFVVTKIIKKAA